MNRVEALAFEKLLVEDVDWVIDWYIKRVSDLRMDLLKKDFIIEKEYRFIKERKVRFDYAIPDIKIKTKNVKIISIYSYFFCSKFLCKSFQIDSAIV